MIVYAAGLAITGGRRDLNNKTKIRGKLLYGKNAKKGKQGKQR